MSDFKTYEYIWLDGYEPEPSMRSKVKATASSTPPDWSFVAHQLYKQKEEALIVCSFLFKHMKIKTGTT